MTFYLFQNEIEEAYNKESNVLKKRKPIDKNEFINEKISNLIDITGYLDIVSEYIKRKGFRESITTYIEKKTPRIVKIGSKKYGMW